MINVLGKKVNGTIIAQNGRLLENLVKMLANLLRCEAVLIMSRESLL